MWLRHLEWDASGLGDVSGGAYGDGEPVGACTMSLVCFGPQRYGSRTPEAFKPGRRVLHVVEALQASVSLPVGGHDRVHTISLVYFGPQRCDSHAAGHSDLGTSDDVAANDLTEDDRWR
jgi:hypothetical protein